MKLKLNKDLKLPSKIKIKNKIKITELPTILHHYNSSIYDLHNWIINNDDPYGIVNYLRQLFLYIKEFNTNNEKIIIIIKGVELNFTKPIEESLNKLLL